MCRVEDALTIVLEYIPDEIEVFEALLMIPLHTGVHERLVEHRHRVTQCVGSEGRSYRRLDDTTLIDVSVRPCRASRRSICG